jgi:hypothetical protein
VREVEFELYQVDSPLAEERIVVFGPASLTTALEELKREKYREKQILPRLKVYYFNPRGLKDQIEKGKRELSTVYLRKARRSAGLSIFLPTTFAVGSYLSYPLISSLATYPLKSYMASVYEYYRERTFDLRWVFYRILDLPGTGFTATMSLLLPVLPFAAFAVYYAHKYFRKYKAESARHRLLVNSSQRVRRIKSENLKRFAQNTAELVRVVRARVRALSQGDKEAEKHIEEIVLNLQQLWTESKLHGLFDLSHYYADLMDKFSKLKGDIERGMRRDQLRDRIEQIRSNSWLAEVWT